MAICVSITAVGMKIVGQSKTLIFLLVFQFILSTFRKEGSVT